MPLWAKILIPIVAILLVLIIILIIIIKNKKPKSKKIKVDNLFIDSLIETLGGISNVLEVLVDNARLKIKLDNTKICDFDKLKELSGQGVFITGNYVKVLFKYDSQSIKKQIEKRK